MPRMIPISTTFLHIPSRIGKKTVNLSSRGDSHPEAEANNKSSSTSLERLKEILPIRNILTFASPHADTDSLSKEQQTAEVEFLLQRSLPDKNPTIVKT